MKIRFMGLMCHVRGDKSGNGEDIVVLMKEPKHRARFRIRKGELFEEHPDEPENQCLDLSGATIRFSLGAGTADRAHLDGVPSLDKQGGNGAALHPDIAARNTGGNLQSFIVLPAGSYGVEDRYRERGTLAGGAGPQCIARTITYEVPVSAAKVTVSGLPSGPLDLKPDAVFTITNLEPQRSTVSHFATNYRNIFAGNVAIQEVVPAKDDYCDSGSADYVYETCNGEPFKNVGVECTNTQYP